MLENHFLIAYYISFRMYNMVCVVLNQAQILGKQEVYYRTFPWMSHQKLRQSYVFCILLFNVSPRCGTLKMFNVAKFKTSTTVPCRHILQVLRTQSISCVQGIASVVVVCEYESHVLMVKTIGNFHINKCHKCLLLSAILKQNWPKPFWIFLIYNWSFRGNLPLPLWLVEKSYDCLVTLRTHFRGKVPW